MDPFVYATRNEGRLGKMRMKVRQNTNKPSIHPATRLLGPGHATQPAATQPRPPSRAFGQLVEIRVQIHRIVFN